MTMATPRMIGAITEENAAFIEEWESVSPSSQWVIHIDMRGDEAPEEVTQGERFYITTKDRMLTQRKVRDKKNDPFVNGSFRPITVPEDVTVETNPNAMSDEHILSVFKASDLAWDEWMSIVDSPATVQRMLDLADSHQDAEISHKRYNQLMQRRTELHPKAQITTSDEVLKDFLNERGGGSETISMRPRNRRGGGFTRGG